MKALLGPVACGRWAELWEFGGILMILLISFFAGAAVVSIATLVFLSKSALSDVQPPVIRDVR